MKFHRLEITNITSLKGTIVIDFDEILSGEQIFAITGATGSGKSSILSSIALALYGDSHKKSLNNDDFVTLGSDVGKIKLTFTASGKKYSACWECRVTKKNGEKLKTPKISRYISHQEIILDCNAEEILGLSFGQFCKTVILNQGEFSRFISSNFGKRREILEKLYGNEKITTLGKELGNKLKSVEIEKQTIQAKMDGALPYDQQEVDEFKKDLEQAVEESKQSQKHQIPLEQLYHAGRDFEELLRQKTSSKSRKIGQEQMLKKVTSDFNELHKIYNQIVNELKTRESFFQKEAPLLHDAIAIQREINIAQGFCSDLNLQVTNSNDSLERLITQRRELEQKLEELHAQILKYDKSENSLLTITEDQRQILAMSISKTNETKQSLHVITQNYNHFATELKSLTKKEQKISESFSDCNKKITEYNSNKTKGSSEIQSDLNILTELKKVIDNSTNASSNIQELSLAKEKNSIFIEKNDLEHEKIRDLLRKIRFEIDSLDFNHAHQKCLTESIKKNSCVICGTDISKMDLKKTPPFKSVENLRKEEDGLYQKQMDIEIHLATLVEKGSNIREKIKEIQLDISKSEQDLSSTLSSFNIDKPNEIPRIIKSFELQISKAKKNEEHAIELRTQSINLKEQLIEINEEIDNCQKRRDDNSKEITNLTNGSQKLLVQIRTITPAYNEEIEKISKQYELDKNDLLTYEKSQSDISTFTEQLRLLNENIKSMQDQLSALNRNFLDKQGIIEQQQDKLSKLSPEGDPQQKLQLLTNNLSSHKLKHENTQRQVHHKEREKERLAASLEALLDNQNEISRAILNIISKSIEASQQLYPKINDLPEFENIRSGLKKIQAIDYANDIHQNDEQLSLFFQNLLTPYYEQQKNNFETLKERSTHLKLKIEMFEKKKKDQEDSFKTLSLINTRLNSLKDLNDLIGNNEFRNYTLGLIEKVLLTYANTELNSLCDGRYEIFQQERRSAQEFYIIDHWRGGLPRKISTLSGGETFLVSLAMALALADMTRGQTEIDCFYIDEGFGSLDNESIEEALDILSRVRSRGKQIGIISHIETLTDRIPVNILLKKSNFGESTISFNKPRHQ